MSRKWMSDIVAMFLLTVFVVFVTLRGSLSFLNLQGDGYLSELQQRQLKECVERTIKHVVKEDQLLLVAHYGITDHLLPTGLPHPTIMMNLAQENDMSKRLSNALIRPQNFVVFLDDCPFAVRDFSNFVFHTFPKFYETPTAKVVLVMRNAVSCALELYPAVRFINYLTVVSYTRTRLVLHRFVVDGCYNSRPIAYMYTHPPNFVNLNKYQKAKFNNCDLIDHTFPGAVETDKLGIIARFVVKEIAQHLNMKIRLSHNKILYNDKFRVGTVWARVSNASLYTIPFCEEDMIFTVPPSKEIPRIEAWKFIFKLEMWVFTCCSFVLTSVVWWLLDKVENKERSSGMTLAFLKIFSITIWGSLDRIPATKPLRVAFIVYVFYAIHMQTAFTSNLVNLMTVPRYESRIANLKELANSSLPIVVFDEDILLVNNETGIHQKIQDKIRQTKNYITTNEQLIQPLSINMCICSILKLVQLTNETLFYFKDSSLSGKKRYSFLASRLPVFQEKLLDLVTKFVEHGLMVMKYREFESKYKKYDMYHNPLEWDDDEPVVLTTSHVFVVFLIWGVGVAVSILVFVGEIAVATWKKKHKKLQCRTWCVS